MRSIGTTHHIQLQTPSEKGKGDLEPKKDNNMESNHSTEGPVQTYPTMEWAKVLDIPLKASEELVSIDLETDLPEDAADLKTLLVEESSDKEHWLTIAIAYCNQGNVEQGIKLISLALEVFEGSLKASLHTFLSWAYLTLAKKAKDTTTRDGFLNKAENELKNAIGLDASWIGNMLATIDLYYQKGDYDKALETTDIFIKSTQAEERRLGRPSRTNCMFLLTRAKLLYQKKSYTASLHAFQELLVLNPMFKPDPRIGVGLCFWKLKDTKMAIQAWERATELNPADKNLSILALLGKFHETITSSHNDETFKEGFVAALNDLNTIFDSNKESPVLLTLLQHYFYFQKDYSRVIKIYTEKIQPKKQLIDASVYSESTFWCARAYYAKEDYRKSFQLFSESFKNNEDNLLARFGIGQSQIKTNLIEESIITFENIYKTNENIQELNYILGLLYASKALDHETQKSMHGKEFNSLIAKGLQYLERYTNLTVSKKNQLVIPKAYLVMSQLYELQNQYKKSLETLSKASEQIQFVNDGKDNSIPVEIFNNLGCFHFIIGEPEKAKEYFSKSKLVISTDDSTKAMNITVDFNIARIVEETSPSEAITHYSSIISDHPKYIAAQVRNIFCKFVNNDFEKDDSFVQDMENLMAMNENNLEVRSFYTWFLNNDENRSKSILNGLLTTHNKDTLTKYDSHDLYALISLANLYLIIARDLKKTQSTKDMEKSKQSFLKAIQLYQKVLQIDPLNCYAAQGIAICFAQSKRMGPALEILRKVRDSINNVNVHINLSHCLLEMNEYSKAIENYEILLKKFPDIKNKSYILNLLGKAWYQRGLKEHNIQWFFKSLDKIKASIEVMQINERSAKLLSELKFNCSLLQFQIAETLRRSNIKTRKLEDIKFALNELNDAIVNLRELKDNKSFKVVSNDEVEQRIQLGETTMKSSLERCLAEQTKYDEESKRKLEEAKRLAELKEEEEKQRLAKLREAEAEAEAKKIEEFKKLQEEAQKYVQERETYETKEIGESDVENDLGNEEESGQKKRKRKSTGKKQSSKKAKTKANDDSDNDSDEEIKTKRSSGAGKKSNLSNEFVDDSEDEAQYSAASEGDEEGLF